MSKLAIFVAVLAAVSMLVLFRFGNVRAEGENLAVIPDDFEPYNGLTVSYGTGTQIVFLDLEVYRTVGNPSIRIEQHQEGVDINHWRELDGAWIDVGPGDNVVFLAWIKCESGINSPNNEYGGRLGIDLYGYIDGVKTCIAFYPQYAANAASNSTTWTKKTINCCIPSDIYGTINPMNGQSYTIHSNGPYQIVVWFDVRPMNATQSVWFADSTLYINSTPDLSIIMEPETREPITETEETELPTFSSSGVGGGGGGGGGGYVANSRKPKAPVEPETVKTFDVNELFLVGCVGVVVYVFVGGGKKR